MSDQRDKIRSSILNAKKSKRQSKVVEIFGSEVEIKQPTLAQISELSEDSKVPGIIRILKEYCFVPGTDEKVFEDTDIEELMELPTGEWLNEFNDAVSELTGLRMDDVDKSEKN